MLCTLCLAASLLWVVQPLYGGQRRGIRTSLSGNQIANLQKQSTSRRQLKMLHIVLLQYAADYEGKLPALNSHEKLRAQLRPYRLPGAALMDPFSKQAYGTNKSLAGKKLKGIPNAANTLLFWSPRSMPDGHYMILDASGRDRRVTAGEFARLKRTSRL
jgi:hypothetical protein